MRVLFIAGTDSYNFTLIPLAEEFVRKGHNVMIIKTAAGYQHNHMIDGSRLPSEYFNGKSIKDIENYDLAIYEAVSSDKIIRMIEENNIFSFSMCFHFLPESYVMGAGFLKSNITFCLGDYFKNAQLKNGILHEIVPVNSPQYDTAQYRDSKAVEKMVLFLEQHFYPAGTEGKRELADILVRTAKENRNYKFVVKPRTIPSELKNSKHKAPHIYDFIENICTEIPENLILLKDHEDLVDLVRKAEIVGTTFSTAVLPAIIMEKPVFWLKGFKCEETQYYNNSMIEKYYSMLESSGNVIDFRELPERLRTMTKVSGAFADTHIYDIKGKASVKIVEIAEFLNDRVISRNIKLPYLNFDYKNYKSLIDEYVAGHDNELAGDQKNRDILRYIYNTTLELFYLLNLMAGFSFDDKVSEISQKLKKEYFEYSDKELDSEKFRLICKEAYKEFENSVADYAEKNFHLLPPGLKGWFIKWTFLNSREKLSELKYDDLPLDYYYYSAILKMDEGDFKDAETQLQGFLNLYSKVEYGYTECCYEWAEKSARQMIEKIRDEK